MVDQADYTKAAISLNTIVSKTKCQCMTVTAALQSMQREYPYLTLQDLEEIFHHPQSRLIKKHDGLLETYAIAPQCLCDCLAQCTETQTP